MNVNGIGKFALFLIMLSVFPLLADGQQKKIDLGKITIPADFEMGSSILKKGEYQVLLYERHENSSFSLVWRDTQDMEHCDDIETVTEEAAPGAEDSKLVVSVVKVDGEDHVLISYVKGKKVYKSFLRVDKGD